MNTKSAIKPATPRDFRNPSVIEAQVEYLRRTVSELREIVAGMVSAQDAVTQGQERERLNHWLPKARAATASPYQEKP